MGFIDQGKALVSECEANVRGLMQSAVAERAYGEIPALASLAAGLAQLLSSTMSPSSGSSNAVEAAPASPQGEGGTARHSTSPGKKPREAYPKFERREERLVKIGWSKKDRREYEHKTPLEAVRAIVATLLSSANKRGYVRLEDVLPIKYDGAEIPSYQTYLVLAWLRDFGVVEKQGNNGYRLDREKLSHDDIENLLRRTPEQA